MGNALNRELAGIRAHVQEAVPAEVAGPLAADVERKKDVDTAKFAQVGSPMPDFTLPGPAGAQVSLADLTAAAPAVLVFYRGSWCPYCNLTLRTYQQEVVPALAASGARLAAISPELPDGSLSTVESNELTFDVLSDVGNVVARSLGITFRPGEDVQGAMATLVGDVGERNGTGDWELPHPAVLVVGQDRVIRFIDVHPDYTTRTTPEEILAALAN
ncbi:peroxiredoxin-like family protein [Amycolatopsis sp. NPDC059021]|uniref:peroxiredoxin-like family protein n=1 Tax=Amycolatopsis sp. NPDC059021 TaxID=3346704 RepID=UPI00366F55E4